jgi:hypothetical protein
VALLLKQVIIKKENFENATTPLPYDYANKCGFNNCPQTQLPAALSKPTLTSVYNLCYSMIGLLCVAILITALFLDDITDENENGTSERQNVTKKPRVSKYNVFILNLNLISKEIILKKKTKVNIEFI